jgi:hypothetical protein
MAKMTSYCGLDCGTCSARIATEKNDDALRKKTAAEWSKAYSSDIKPADVNCSGCTTADGVHFSYCESACKIRKCARPRKVSTCAACPDYACDKLQDFFKMAPQAKETLDALRK